MKINLTKNNNKELSKNLINIKLEYNIETPDIKQLIWYIENYNNSIFVKNNYEVEEICYKDIICFFSEKKYNYCQTLNGVYEVKCKLYEIENLRKDFIRVSKKCIINIEHIKKFDISKSGRIKINLDNNTFQYVSRRRIKDVIDFLDERMI